VAIAGRGPGREGRGRTVRQRVDLGRLGRVAVDPAQAGERVDAVNVHRARAADALAARAPERQRRVDLVLNLDQSVEHCREESATMTESDRWGWWGNERREEEGRGGRRRASARGSVVVWPAGKKGAAAWEGRASCPPEGSRNALIGPVSDRSRSYVCILGFSDGWSGFYMGGTKRWKRGERQESASLDPRSMGAARIGSSRRRSPALSCSSFASRHQGRSDRMRRRE